MPLPSKRRAAFLAGLGGALLLAGGAAVLILTRQVRAALAVAPQRTAPLSFLPVADPTVKVDRWGGGEVVAVAVTPEALLTGGGSGVRDGQGDLSTSLPTLRVSALTLWRGSPVAALAAGGLFLRRDGRWEAFRTGFGPLHGRALLETPGGELLIGASEGLFRAAWGADRIERLDVAPVQTLALGPAGMVFAGGETGLRRVEGRQVRALPSPDPWIQWVGVAGNDLLVVTPLGLARGPLEGALAAVPGAEQVDSAAVVEGQVQASGQGRLFRFDAAGRPAESFPPARPVRVLEAAGQLFVDTVAGLYRRVEGRWELARPRPPSLPPGSSHVGALAWAGGHLVVGFFDQGLAVGDPAQAGWAWQPVPGAAAWGVNALLPAGGSLYVASLRGVARLDGLRLTPVGESGQAAFALASSPGGVVRGYGQGVALPDGRFLSAFHGLPGNQALALAQEDDGLLFVGTPTGLGALQGARVAWRLTAGDGKLPNAWVDALACFKGALYLGTYGGGVARRTAPVTDRAALGTFEAFPETEGLKVSGGCLVAAGGTLLAGTDGRGLYRLASDGQRFLPVDAPLPSPHITAILPAQGGLFIGTDEGLARIPFPLPGESD